MATSGDDAVNPELESFREQWICDLQSRKENPTAEPPSSAPQPARQSIAPPPPTHSVLPANDDDDDSSDVDGDETGLFLSSVPRKLVSALDHYEEAMRMEAQGNMGESLRLYRKAFRVNTESSIAILSVVISNLADASQLDPQVDKTYREKHAVQTAVAPAPAPAPAPHAADQPPPLQHPDALPSLDELIASFSAFQVEPAPPVIPGDITPPCPISRLPDELLTHILTDVAVSDVGDFARLSLVCKRLAYLVAAEQRIWKRVCVGSEFGFRGMHRRWAAGIEWEPLDENYNGGDADISLPITLQLNPSYPSWKHMFRNRPRIRFNGCYISTVNYVRNGQHATNQTVWGGAPILIVTYYRYLRFFRDGSLISLLTTAPPLDVVHHLTRHALILHRDAAHNAHLPSSLMQHAYRGRWRMSETIISSSSSSSPSSAAATTNNEVEDCENDLFVETEGAAGKYTYRMDLSIQNAGKAAAAARNTKLVWKGFYCFNKLTGDWGDFHLKNDKPFLFSRVKSYGFGDLGEAHSTDHP